MLLLPLFLSVTSVTSWVGFSVSQHDLFFAPRGCVQRGLGPIQQHGTFCLAESCGGIAADKLEPLMLAALKTSYLKTQLKNSASFRA